MEAHDDDLRISTDHSGTVFVAGEVDLAGAPALDAALRAWGDHVVRIDMSKVTFLDSTGVNVLIAAVHERHGGSVVLERISAPALRTLEIAGVLPLFERAA